MTLDPQSLLALAKQCGIAVAISGKEILLCTTEEQLTAFAAAPQAAQPNAIAAFEAKYQRSAQDPSSEYMLELFSAGFAAAQPDREALHRTPQSREGGEADVLKQAANVLEWSAKCFRNRGDSPLQAAEADEFAGKLRALAHPKADSTEAKTIQFTKAACVRCGQMTIMHLCNACADSTEAQGETVPWPKVVRYTGGGSSEGAYGRVWLELGDGPEETEYVPVQPMTPAVPGHRGAIPEVIHRKSPCF